MRGISNAVMVGVILGVILVAALCAYPVEALITGPDLMAIACRNARHAQEGHAMMRTFVADPAPMGSSRDIHFTHALDGGK